HQERPGAPVRAIESIRKAEIEGAVPAAIRVQLPVFDLINALGRLPVACPQFRPEISREIADRIGGKFLEPGAALQPDFKFEGLLEDADENGRTQLESARSKPCLERNWICSAGGQRICLEPGGAAHKALARETR